MTTIHADEMTKALKWLLNDRQKGRGELFFCYIRRLKDFMWGNKEEATWQMKEWRKMKKQGLLYIDAFNNMTIHINGTTWYMLVIQSGSSPKTIKSVGIDPMGIGFDSPCFVDGYIYCFKQKANRDAIYEYVMKP
jgi:hypothetical protein